LKITAIIWKERFVEKLLSKHGVSIADAEEVILSRPLIRRVSRGRVRGEDVYSPTQINNGRYLIVFFIKKKHGMMLPISARDMDSSERRYYGKHKQSN